MDWDEVLARLKRRTAAAARATQRLEEVEKEQASTEDAQEGEASDMSSRSHVLSPRARAINDAILARRKGVQRCRTIRETFTDRALDTTWEMPSGGRGGRF